LDSDPVVAWSCAHLIEQLQSGLVVSLNVAVGVAPCQTCVETLGSRIACEIAASWLPRSVAPSLMLSSAFLNT